MTGMVVAVGITETIAEIIAETIMMVIIADSEVVSLDGQAGGPDSCADMEDGMTVTL